MRLTASAILGAFVLSACTPELPPRWAEGGAALTILAARWQRPEADDIQIREDGYVLEGDDPIFYIDRVGRIVDDDRDPVGILLADGLVVGTNKQWLGRVGLTNASPPGQETAWLSVMKTGEVLYFDSDGERKAGGFWQGCSGAALRTCTLVTHLIAVRKLRSQPRTTFVIQTGVGL